MRKIGFTEDTIERLVCPIGLTDIRDKAPAAIAAAVVAQLLMVRDRICGEQRGGISTVDRARRFRSLPLVGEG